jgi:hypothetical protein
MKVADWEGYYGSVTGAAGLQYAYEYAYNRFYVRLFEWRLLSVHVKITAAAVVLLQSCLLIIVYQVE